MLSRHTSWKVCPWNRRFAAERTEPDYAARGPGERPEGVEVAPSLSRVSHLGAISPELVDLLKTALDEAARNSFSRGSALRCAGRPGFTRNVCVALGNWGSSDAVPSLVSTLSNPEPLVRAHAAWALGRIGDPAAVSALEARAKIESRASVREEVSRALSPPTDTDSRSRRAADR